MFIKNNILLKVLIILLLLNILNFIKFANAESENQEQNQEKEKQEEEKEKEKEEEKIKPLVSIIIPSYNSAKYLDRCIEHALKQTLKNVEVIVINDNSSDNTEEILAKYTNDKRFKYASIHPNHGAAMGRNIGMDLSTGEFIGFVDSDDYVDYEFFEFLYKLSKDKDIVIGMFVNSTNDSNKYFKHPKWERYGCVGDTIWRKSFIDENNVRFNTTLKIAEDLNFREKVYALKPRRMDAPDEGIYYYYKRREGSLMNYTNSFIDGMTDGANKSEFNSSSEYRNVDFILFKMKIRPYLKYIKPASAVLIIIIIIILTIVLICCCYRHRKRKFAKLNGSNEKNILLNNEDDDDDDDSVINVDIDLNINDVNNNNDIIIKSSN
ncbi:nucleotide-diphospho-sugar transferase [Anaeromyces robustus]|uniref:Nucleotide-diphospho-sugar transferase n=1 Tax=Anaeromyces robustus TaxID=1754192 RepID=A0A1Y1WUB7_9FUNG|nr:nucleotide-diphospho-sugar transferase [Anaeromyces robustus]|eukprot:ORX76898.1 nucleotide-diphospho-sugar transferase [Anaeromyces robustus]